MKLVSRIAMNPDESLDATTDVELQQTAKRRTVVGPWKNLAEFNKVYEWLFGADVTEDTREWALSQMRVWSLRRSALCPAAVLATAVIVEVQLKDNPETTKSDVDLQILYASAFTRFFNFMSSIMQTHNMRTMYDTARQLGLQSFVVDLRHICAHGQVLPPLQVLRNTAKYCLSWLHDYYWTTQRETMCNVDASRIRRKDKTEFDEKVSQLFEIYDAALECFLKGADNIKMSKRHLHGRRFVQLKSYYNDHKLQSLREVFDSIVRKLCSLVKRVAVIKDLSDIYIEALLKMKCFFSLANVQDSGHDLETVIAVTQTLFRMLAVHGFLEDLFLSLIDMAENPALDASRRAGAGFWALQIAAGFVAFRRCKRMYKGELDENPEMKEFSFTSTKVVTIPQSVRELLIYSGVDMKRTLVFGDSFRRPWVWVFDRSFMEERLATINEYTAPVLKSLLPLIEPELSSTETETLTDLIDTFLETNTETKTKGRASRENGKHEVYTANDLLKRLNSSASTMELDEAVAEKQTTFGVWTMVSDDETHDWKSCPLGRLPWE